MVINNPTPLFSPLDELEEILSTSKEKYITEPKYKVSVYTNNLQTYDRELADYLHDILHNAITEIPFNLPQGRYAIAGGALRSFYERSTPRDIDIYWLDSGVTAEIQRIWTNGINKSVEKYSATSITYPSKTMDIVTIPKANAQLISISYDPAWRYTEADNSNNVSPTNTKPIKSKLSQVNTLDELLDSFDFTCCKLAVGFDVLWEHGERLRVDINSYQISSTALQDIARRQLRLGKIDLLPHYGVPYKRFCKYLSYGYIASDNTLHQLESRTYDGFVHGHNPLQSGSYGLD